MTPPYCTVQPTGLLYHPIQNMPHLINDPTLYICTCLLQKPLFGALLEATTTIHRASLYNLSVLSPFTDNPILNLLKGGWPRESEGAESWEHAAGTRAGQWQVLTPET